MVVVALRCVVVVTECGVVVVVAVDCFPEFPLRPMMTPTTIKTMSATTAATMALTSRFWTGWRFCIRAMAHVGVIVVEVPSVLVIDGQLSGVLDLPAGLVEDHALGSLRRRRDPGEAGAR